MSKNSFTQRISVSPKPKILKIVITILGILSGVIGWLGNNTRIKIGLVVQCDCVVSYHSCSHL